MTDKAYILWDFDGTLGHRPGMWSGTLLEVLEAHGLGHVANVEQLRPFLLNGFRWHRADVVHRQCCADEWWSELEPLFGRAFCEGAGIAQAQAATLAREVREQYLQAASWQLFGETREALAALAGSGWQHVLLTNHVPELRSILQALQIDSQFTGIFNSAETGLEKPHREAFENVRRTLPRDATLWMVGDSYAADVAGAQGAGIPAILVRKAHPDATRFAVDLTGVHAFLAKGA